MLSLINPTGREIIEKKYVNQLSRLPNSLTWL